MGFNLHPGIKNSLDTVKELFSRIIKPKTASFNIAAYRKTYRCGDPVGGNVQP